MSLRSRKGASRSESARERPTWQHPDLEAERLVGLSLGSSLHVEQLPENDSHMDLRVQLPSARLDALALAMGRSPGEFPSWLRVHDDTLHHLSRLLWEEQAAGAPCGGLYTEALASALMVRLLVRHGPAASPGARFAGLPGGVLRKVKDFIEVHLAEELSRQRLASVAGLSPSRFSTLFRASTQQSPYQFVLRRRVERARELLTTSALPISAVALRVGFYDQSHLTRQMRRVLGMSPRELQRTKR